MEVSPREKLILIQDLLHEHTSYWGSSDGTIEDEDVEQVEQVISELEDLTDPEVINSMIVALKICGFNDNLVANGAADEQFALALCRAFNMPEPPTVK